MLKVSSMQAVDLFEVDLGPGTQWDPKGTKVSFNEYETGTYMFRGHLMLSYLKNKLGTYFFHGWSNENNVYTENAEICHHHGIVHYYSVKEKI